MLKRYTFLSLIVLLLFVSCFSLEEKERVLKKATFDKQRSYLLKQVTFDFTPLFDVWKNEPVSLFDYPDIKTMLNDRYFKARKKFRVGYNEFIITDMVKNKKYILEEKDFFSSDNKRMLLYEIKEDEKILCRIRQKKIDSFLTFEIIFSDNDKEIYELIGEVKKVGKNIYGFEFLLKKKDTVLGSIFKEFRYFINQYDIIINASYKDFSDPLFICFGVFIDQVLKERGFRYKSEIF